MSIFGRLTGRQWLFVLCCIMMLVLVVLFLGGVRSLLLYSLMIISGSGVIVIGGLEGR